MPISSKFICILKISLVNQLVVHNLIKIIGKKIWYLLQWKFSIFVILSCYYDSNRSAKTTSQNSKAHYQNKNLGKSSIKHVNINRGKSLHKGLYRYEQPCTGWPMSLMKTSSWLGFWEFRHPVWAVGSYLSGPPAAGTDGTESTGGFHQRHGSPCTYLH